MSDRLDTIEAVNVVLTATVMAMLGHLGWDEGLYVKLDRMLSAAEGNLLAASTTSEEKLAAFQNFARSARAVLLDQKAR